MTRNNRAVNLLLYAFCLCLAPLLRAQTISSDTPEEPAVITRGSDPSIVPGTSAVSLRLEEPVSSALTRDGDRIHFTLTRNLFLNGRLITPEGASFYATAHVRPKTGHHSGSVSFSDADLAPGTGQRIRLVARDSSEKLGPGAIPVLALGVVVLGPVVAVQAPISLTWCLINELHERRIRSQAHTPKPQPVDLEFSAGEVFTYYADYAAMVRHQSKRVSTHPVANRVGTSNPEPDAQAALKLP